MSSVTLQQIPEKYVEVDLARHRAELQAIIEAVRSAPRFDERVLRSILRRHPRNGEGFFSKSELVAAYRAFCQSGELPFERETLYRLQMKPMRTQSGVAPVAVLTKPAGCPARCIFCPNDPDMPKSYLSREPGAQRALRHGFDPYDQTKSRLNALYATGHAIQKAELLILGGTWSAYPASYAEWFVKRCLDAMNGQESATLDEAQRRNEVAATRCVGLTIETRPDWVTPAEVLRLRRLGVTRVQLGIQSLDDRILQLNRRGHDVAAARQAVTLLRSAGFKLHLHWMPNLLGATPESDQEDFARLWSDPAMKPDELKIYPCSLIEDTELYEIWQAGGYSPYDEPTLVELLAHCKSQVPVYTRLSRIIRDIPAGYVVEGNRQSNLREIVQAVLASSGRRCRCIRCREIGDGEVDLASLYMISTTYATTTGQEHFLTIENSSDQIVAFLRLLVPGPHPLPGQPPELHGCAVIREVHVYGPALHLGTRSSGEAQHLGLGSRLLDAARALAKAEGVGRLAVIAAVGTREYYRARGFELGELYMHRRV